jgi:hypothetical protein
MVESARRLRFKEGMQMRNQWIALFIILAVVACSGIAFAQCNGLQYVGQLYGQGSFNSNYYGFREVLLPTNAKIDSSYHQPSIAAVANGKSDARSRLVASEVPAGICIAPSGDNNAAHGWSVGDGADPRIQLAPATWDMSTNTITQYKFGMRLYCTTGSGELDRTTGGCNVKVDVFYKPASSASASLRGVVVQGVNLRPEPSTANKPIGVLQAREEVEFLSTEPVRGFVQVKARDGRKGWVGKQFVRIKT